MTWLGAALLAGLLAGLWGWLVGGRKPSAGAGPVTDVRRDEVVPPRSGHQSLALAQLRLLAALARSADAERSAHAHAQLPHPITDDHRRLYRDVDLLQAAEEAIEQARFDDARALLLTHQRELPGMSPLEAEGLWLLVDCLEHPSANHTARVQTFYDEHTASTVRRRLRRSCLERAR